MDANGIRFTTVRCALGWLLVAGTRRGVCNLRFGDDERDLERDLRDEFPWAEVRRDADALQASVDALARYLEGRTRHLELRLDVRGSQFQRRVWDAIREIPYGETRSYGELARAMGRPTAARAVARACANNPVALAVPCHRVIGSCGGIRGYRWGLERKRALLALEKKESDSSLSFDILPRWPAPPSTRSGSRSRRVAAPRGSASSPAPSRP